MRTRELSGRDVLPDRAEQDEVEADPQLTGLIQLRKVVVKPADARIRIAVLC